MSEVFNKSDLVERFAEEFSVTKKDATVMVQYMLDQAADELGKGNSVDLFGFGKFSVKVKPEHEGYNPAAKEKITIPEKKSVTFKPAKALKERLG